MDKHVVIDFPKKMIVINADDEVNGKEVDLVNERRNSNFDTQLPGQSNSEQVTFHTHHSWTVL